jgi:hypothetical protein
LFVSDFLVDYTANDSHVIFLAARYGHVAFLQFLFALPRIDILSENALIPACEFGHFECVRMLWERGIDPSRYDRLIRFLLSVFPLY